MVRKRNKHPFHRGPLHEAAHVRLDVHQQEQGLIEEPVIVLDVAPRPLVVVAFHLRPNVVLIVALAEAVAVLLVALHVALLLEDLQKGTISSSPVKIFLEEKTI